MKDHSPSPIPSPVLPMLSTNALAAARYVLAFIIIILRNLSLVPSQEAELRQAL